MRWTRPVGREELPSHTPTLSTFLSTVSQIYRVTRNDRVYQGMSIAFDFSLGEIWPTWIAGATLVTGPQDAQRMDRWFTEFLVEHNITVLCCMPTQLATIERDVPSLRTLLVGEACPADLISRWLHRGRRMLKTFGPFETMVTAICCELFPGHPPTVGLPLPTFKSIFWMTSYVSSRMVRAERSVLVALEEPAAISIAWIPRRIASYPILA